MVCCGFLVHFLFFIDTATTESYTYCHTLPLPDALPICLYRRPDGDGRPRCDPPRAAGIAGRDRRGARNRMARGPRRRCAARDEFVPRRERHTATARDRKSTRLNSSH